MGISNTNGEGSRLCLIQPQNRGRLFVERGSVTGMVVGLHSRSLVDIAAKEKINGNKGFRTDGAMISVRL